MAPEDTDKPAEFPSEDHRKGHIAGLVSEQKGYETKAEGLAARGDNDAAELYKGRASQVGEELKRLAGDAKPAAQRAEKR